MLVFYDMNKYCLHEIKFCFNHMTEYLHNHCYLTLLYQLPLCSARQYFNILEMLRYSLDMNTKVILRD